MDFCVFFLSCFLWHFLFPFCIFIFSLLNDPMIWNDYDFVIFERLNISSRLWSNILDQSHQGGLTSRRAQDNLGSILLSPDHLYASPFQELVYLGKRILPREKKTPRNEHHQSRTHQHNTSSTRASLRTRFGSQFFPQHYRCPTHGQQSKKDKEEKNMSQNKYLQGSANLKYAEECR